MPLLDAVFPRRPLVASLSEVGGSAWGHLNFIDKPYCNACGLPFEFDEGEEALCAPCSARLPVYDKARAALIYDEHSRRMVMALKHGGRTENVGVFAAQMLRAGRDMWASADLLMPVPLHPRRLVKRRFNQAALLARQLSKLTALPYDTGSLIRTRATPPQGHMSWRERKKNVAGAFTVDARRAALVKGTHIVLIDDVMTTGATLNACARTLKRAGAEKVSCVTLTRTVRARQADRPLKAKAKGVHG